MADNEILWASREYKEIQQREALYHLNLHITVKQKREMLRFGLKKYVRKMNMEMCSLIKKG